MNIKTLLVFTLILHTSFESIAQYIEYPIAKKINVIDTFYTNHFIQDEYRWMENINDPELKTWINEQNKLSKNYLEKASNKYRAFTTIDKYSYTEYSNPRKMGNFYFTIGYYNNIGVPALFYKNNLNADYELLVDPNYISNKDIIRLKGYSISKDSKLLAYQYSRNGSDWAEIKIVTLDKKEDLNDYLKNIKFSSIEWKGKGFFYSTYQNNNNLGPTKGEQVFYHKVGTNQTDDELVFMRENPDIYFEYLVTSDERFFILKETNEKTGKINIFYTDYNSSAPTLKPLLMNLTDNITIIDSHNGKLIAETTLNCNNGQIIEIDPANPRNLRSIVPEFGKEVLIGVKPMLEKIITIYQANQRPFLKVFNYNGELLYNLEFEIATSIGNLSGNINDDEILFYFTSYTIPPVVYSFNINSFQRKLIKHTSVSFDYKDIEYKEIEYISNDSIKVPMFLVYKKGIKLDGNNPTLLKAYGGFGVINQPHFDPGIVYFISNGGLVAYANIRGGGDYGESWALDGKGKNKQNSFDDFIAAAEYLIKNKYTNSNKLASTGASNGGLVVAAAAVQRPDLFKTVIPVVGPFDMIRFENFTVGSFHKDEYGTVSDSSSFLNLLHYSPYQNIKEEINYPSMLIMTSENDDRVPPLHSYKFAAKLQNRKAQKNPIYLRVEKKAGHSGSIGMIDDIKEISDLYVFIISQLNID
ncbi:MAG: prolyl oligopeptidase family serine peptidase [Bacteroidales bacterium]